ncbi:hypothetical protein G7Y89_g1127 [Cudoniella acicularis]|uniref:Uncharacterized protein n=1 Tax=Cudoniella acicularis TaxID=354080 RepID=A0A8H4RVV8_9HELO|nr:hypothetical protein G7Y89_g1127 [Cudoniella acicularis]
MIGNVGAKGALLTAETARSLPLFRHGIARNFHAKVKADATGTCVNFFANLARLRFIVDHDFLMAIGPQLDDRGVYCDTTIETKAESPLANKTNWRIVTTDIQEFVDKLVSSRAEGEVASLITTSPRVSDISVCYYMYRANRLSSIYKVLLEIFWKHQTPNSSHCWTDES